MATTPEIIDWSASRLTNGSYLNYGRSVVSALERIGFDHLRLQALGPELQSALSRFAEFVNKSSAFIETPEIAKADAKRDALFKAIWYAWHYAAEVDEDCEFGHAALMLRPVMISYKGAYKHELTKETSELVGFVRDLSTSENIVHVQRLGLDKLLAELRLTNEAIENATTRRETERGERIADKGDDTTASVRKRIGSLLSEVYKMINALNQIQPELESQKAATDVCGIIAHYKLVAKKPPKEQDEPEPTPEPNVEASAT